ncbi:MAG TPA: sigma-54 dependent transcriptional regulator, partial [Longimicrobiales bacterium]|nr:sigma-54 dependent transcriptional regulator [Longimicrobiales bacterium]
SRAAADIREFVRIAASVDAPVLVTGETGTGKGVVAAAIHRGSARAARPLVEVNCAGVPETLFESEFFGHARGAFTGAMNARRGLFEQAHEGTLFLDEIGELTLPLQAKLLTTIERGVVRRLGAETTAQVNARTIAATSVRLEEAVTEGTFRLDLYHRLLVLSYHLPALRERGADIMLLARHFLCTFAARHARRIGDFSADAVRLIEGGAWPGNIRQLAHAVEAAVLRCDGGTIHAHHIPAALRPAAGTAIQPNRYSFFGSRAAERDRIIEALRSCHGNRTRAARMLRMSRNTLASRLRDFDIVA